MEKYQILVKIFEVNESLKKRPIESKEYQVEKDKVGRLPESAKSILCFLLQKDSINQRTIAKSLNISAQAVSEAMKKLEEKGYIIKINGEINNENLIMLTEPGKTLAMKFDYHIKLQAEDALAQFTIEEIEELYRLMEKIIV